MARGPASGLLCLFVPLVANRSAARFPATKSPCRPSPVLSVYGLCYPSKSLNLAKSFCAYARCSFPCIRRIPRSKSLCSLNCNLPEPLIFAKICCATAADSSPLMILICRSLAGFEVPDDRHWPKSTFPSVTMDRFTPFQNRTSLENTRLLRCYPSIPGPRGEKISRALAPQPAIAPSAGGSSCSKPATNAAPTGNRRLFPGSLEQSEQFTSPESFRGTPALRFAKRASVPSPANIGSNPHSQACQTPVPARFRSAKSLVNADLARLHASISSPRGGGKPAALSAPSRPRTACPPRKRTVRYGKVR